MPHPRRGQGALQGLSSRLCDLMSCWWAVILVLSGLFLLAPLLVSPFLVPTFVSRRQLYLLRITPHGVLCFHLANSIKPKAFPHYKASLLNLLPENSYLTFPRRPISPVCRCLAVGGACSERLRDLPKVTSKAAAKRHTKVAVPWVSHHTTVTLLSIPICRWIFIKSRGPS